MSSSPPATLRRSGRDKKQVKHFTSLDSTRSGKRKRTDRSEDENDNTSDAPRYNDEGEDADGEGDPDDDAEDEESGEQRTKRKSGKGKKQAKLKGPPPAKKQRVLKQQPATKKSVAPKTTRNARTKKPAVNRGDFDANALAKESKISADNPLFNAILNPSAALQSTVDDFLQSLQQSPGVAQAELVNLILRACGCNDIVDSDMAIDYDGVVDALDNFTEGLKQDDTPVYPLTSKLAIFRKFRKSLSEFLERLVLSSAELGLLYSSDLMSTLQTWVVAMSSSQIRSFRHTATVVALEVETALCDVAAAVERESELIGRQKQGEKKRKAANKEAGRVREKGLETKAAALRERRKALAEFIKEFVDGVFVHRYRDLDPNIRAECVYAIGLWFKKYPSHFLDGSYLRYVGWVLSDSDSHVRLSAIKSLSIVYTSHSTPSDESTSYVSSLSQFTERFKPRLMEMARGDIELNVRVAVIQVLTAIDEHSLLEDDERERLCLLVLDEESRVRKAVSGFVEGVWRDGVEERLVGRKVGEADKRRAGIKELGVLIVRWSRELERRRRKASQGQQDDDDDNDQEDDDSEETEFRELASLISSGQDHTSRIDCIIEALWDKVAPISDWEQLLDYLLLDHSPPEANPIITSPSKKSRQRRIREQGRRHKRPKKSMQNGGDSDLTDLSSSEEQDLDDDMESVVDEAWRLEEVEEGVLLEVLVASLAMAEAEALHATKKGEENSVENDITRALIKGIPRLISKHQTDRNRIVHVLRMPPLMNLDLYLEMRLMAGYANLWEDITKQFLAHSSKSVLSHAVSAIRHLLDATSLSNTNKNKLSELEDQLSKSLHDAVGGRDNLEISSLNEDEVAHLTAICSRLSAFAGVKDITVWMEESEGGKQSSAWDIVSAIVERGRLGYLEEELMIEQAMLLLTLHIMWKAQSLANGAESPEYSALLKEQRDPLLEKMMEYSVGTQTNAIDGVKRAAFQNVLNLHILFSSIRSSPFPVGEDEDEDSEDSSLALTMGEEAQFRCAGFIQAQVEQYVEDVGLFDEDGVREMNGHDKDDDDEEQSSDSDNDQGAKKRKGKKTGKKNGHNVPAAKTSMGTQNNVVSISKLQREYQFMSVVFAFLRALHAGVISALHSSVLLSQHGRLGSAFNACSKGTIDILRAEGINGQNGELVKDVVVQALTGSFTLFLDGLVGHEEHTISLAKLLVGCIVVRGAQLAVVARLDGECVVEIHTSLLTWIAKRLVAYQKNDNKKGRKKASLFFRAMVPLLLGMPSKDALRIKAHLEQTLSQSNIETSTSSKLWDPLRAYEKRLTTAVTKEKPKATKARKGNRTREAGADTDQESELTSLTDDDNVLAAKVPTRPKPRPRTRAEKRASDAENSNTDTDANGELEVTPKANRTRRKPLHVPSALDAEPEPEREPEVDPDLDAEGELEPPPTSSPNGTSPAKKRQRDIGEDDDDGTQIDEDMMMMQSSPAVSGSSRAATPANAMPVRRKRVRH